MAWQFYKMLWYCLNLEIERFGETCLQIKLSPEALPPASKFLQILQPILFATWNYFFFIFKKNKINQNCQKYGLSALWNKDSIGLAWIGMNFCKSLLKLMGKTFYIYHKRLYVASRNIKIVRLEYWRFLTAKHWAYLRLNKRSSYLFKKFSRNSQ